MEKHSSSHHQHAGPSTRKSWRSYLPLVVLIGTSMVAASALEYGASGGHAMAWMHYFMGIFLTMFALLKLFDLPAFADGFQMYDLLAKPVRPYAFVYPFIELGLALGYLSFWRPTLVYGVTVVVLGFGALGVINALRRKLDVECACMGTILKVPLSTVALVEDVGMAIMAAAMWVRVAA